MCDWCVCDRCVSVWFNTGSTDLHLDQWCGIPQFIFVIKYRFENQWNQLIYTIWYTLRKKVLNLYAIRNLIIVTYYYYYMVMSITLDTTSESYDHDNQMLLMLSWCDGVISEMYMWWWWWWVFGGCMVGGCVIGEWVMCEVVVCVWVLYVRVWCVWALWRWFGGAWVVCE